MKAELPDLGNGPHFFYGLQWWFFGLLAVFGFFYLAYDEWTRRGAQPASERAQHPAVDGQHHAGDERRRRREQEGRRPAELLRLAVAAQGDLRERLRLGGLGVTGRLVELGDPLGADATGQQPVDATPRADPARRPGSWRPSPARAAARWRWPGPAAASAPTTTARRRPTRPAPARRTPRGRCGPPRGTPSRTTSTSPRRTCSTPCPSGGPPTEIRAPSSRPNASRAASMSRAGVAGSALSASTVTAASPSAAAASARESALRPEITTFAPSATSTSAVARPRPRAPPVTM